MESRKFTCGSCSYSATVVGGLSSEFAGDTVTHVCHDCRELKEVLVRRYEKTVVPSGPAPTLTTPYSSEPIIPTCDRNPEHQIERWPTLSGNQCPRCDGMMS